MSDDVASQADRARVYRIRRKLNDGGVLTPEEATFYAAYEEKRRAHSMGASASSRSIHIEEQQMAVGTGAAAETAAAAALAKAEGQRVDYLVRAGADSLVKACELHRAMAATMLDRLSQLETVHVALLESVRAHYVARTEAEAELIRREADEGGDVDKEATHMLMEMLRGDRRGPPPPRRGPPPRVPPRRGPPPRAAR